MKSLATLPASDALRLRLDRPIPLALGWIALGALWLLGRRYKGITHDAGLYFAQALRRLEPDGLAGDLFFAFHSQDGYSLFPALYALLIQALGPGNAALAVTLAGQVAFVAAAWALATRFLAGDLRWWALALLACLSGYYGGLGVFRLAEPFATARTWAEPLAVAALALTLARRPALAAAALAGSAVLHPLVAAPAMIAVALFHLQRPRLAFFVTATAAAALLFSFGPRLDPAWLEPLVERSPHLFMTRWDLADWSRVVWGLCLARLAWDFLAPDPRRLLTMIATTALAGLAASAIAEDGLHSAAAAALQMWRAHWVLHLAAILLVPLVARELWRGGRASQLAAACIVASCCFARDELWLAALLAMAALALRKARLAWLAETAYRFLLVVLAGAASVGLLLAAQAHMPTTYGAALPPSWLEHLVSAGTLLPLAFLLWLALRCGWLGRAGGVFALTAMMVGTLGWDSRAAWARAAETGGAPLARFRDAVPPRAQVFWPGQSSPAWLVLHRPNWHSADQGAGIVFSRDTALEFHARKAASAALKTAMDACQLADAGECRIGAQLVRDLCERPAAPTHLVLNAPVDDGRRALAVLHAAGRSYHLFGC